MKKARTCNGCRGVTHTTFHWQSERVCAYGFSTSSNDKGEMFPLQPCPKPTFFEETYMIECRQLDGKLLPYESYIPFVKLNPDQVIRSEQASNFVGICGGNKPCDTINCRMEYIIICRKYREWLNTQDNKKEKEVNK